MPELNETVKLGLDMQEWVDSLIDFAGDVRTSALDFVDDQSEDQAMLVMVRIEYLQRTVEQVRKLIQDRVA